MASRATTREHAGGATTASAAAVSQATSALSWLRLQDLDTLLEEGDPAASVGQYRFLRRLYQTTIDPEATELTPDDKYAIDVAIAKLDRAIALGEAQQEAILKEGGALEAEYGSDSYLQYVQERMQQQAQQLRPVRMTGVTRSVLRTLVDRPGRPLWTTAIADLADVSAQSVQSCMERLEKAGWATSTKETREQASERGRGARRMWQLTEDGHAEAEKAIAQSRQRAETRAQTLDL